MLENHDRIRAQSCLHWWAPVSRTQRAEVSTNSARFGPVSSGSVTAIRFVPRFEPVGSQSWPVLAWQCNMRDDMKQIRVRFCSLAWTRWTELHSEEVLPVDSIYSDLKMSSFSFSQTRIRGQKQAAGTASYSWSIELRSFQVKLVCLKSQQYQSGQHSSLNDSSLKRFRAVKV